MDKCGPCFLHILSINMLNMYKYAKKCKANTHIIPINIQYISSQCNWILIIDQKVVIYSRCNWDTYYFMPVTLTRNVLKI